MKRRIAALLLALLMTASTASMIACEKEGEGTETKVTETAAPETAAPETAAPETAAPETEAPATEAPETEAPETEATETDAPFAAPEGVVNLAELGTIITGAEKDVSVLFDGTEVTGMHLDGTGEDYWVGVELPEPCFLSHVRISAWDHNADGTTEIPYAIHRTMVEASNDGETWEFIMLLGDPYFEYDEYAYGYERGNNFFTEYAFDGEEDEDIDATEPVKYKYYRMWNNDNCDDWGEVEFWGSFGDVPAVHVPETEAPETDAPETDAHETNVPETAAPETSAPVDAPEGVVDLAKVGTIITGSEKDVSVLFDGTEVTGMTLGGTGEDYWVGVELAEPCFLSHVRISAWDHNADGTTEVPWAIHRTMVEASNDGETWEFIMLLGDPYFEYDEYAYGYERGNNFFTEYAFDGEEDEDIDATEPVKYKYYRMWNNDNCDDWGEVEFWGSFGDVPAVHVPETDAPETEAPETTAPETAAPETSAPVDAPEGVVNLAELGTIITGSEKDVSVLFDGTEVTGMTLGGTGEDYWVGVELAEPCFLSHVRVSAWDHNADGTTEVPWAIHRTMVEASNDGETWEFIMLLGDPYFEYDDYAYGYDRGNNFFTEYAFDGEEDEDIDATEPVKYKYYRMWNNDNCDDWGEVEFWGSFGDVPAVHVPETEAPETDAPETDAPETEAPETEQVIEYGTDGDVRFILVDAAAKAGEEVVVTVKVESKAGIVCNSLALAGVKYDAAVLELVGFANPGDIAEKHFAGADYAYDNDKGAITVGALKAGEMNGTICDVVFKVLDTAAAGETVVTFKTIVVKNGSEALDKGIVPATITIAE